MSGISDNIILLPSTYTKYGNRLFCTCKDFNLMYSIDLVNSDIVILGSVPEISLISFELFSCSANYDGAVFFIPGRYNSILVKENDGRWSRIEICSKNGEEKGRYKQCVKCGEKLFLIGSDCSQIVCINLKTRKVEKIIPIYNKHVGSANSEIFWVNYARQGDVLYLSSVISNRVLKFNMQDYSFQWIEIGEEGDSYSGITFDGHSFWLVPKMGKNIVQWDGFKLQRFYRLPFEILKGGFHIPEVYMYHEQLVFHDYIKNKRVAFNPNTERFNITQENLYRDRILDDASRIRIYKNGNIEILEALGAVKHVHCRVRWEKLKEYATMFNSEDKNNYVMMKLLMLGGNILSPFPKADEIMMNEVNIGEKIWKNVREVI